MAILQAVLALITRSVGRSVGAHAATTTISLGSLLAGQLNKRRLRT